MKKFYAFFFLILAAATMQAQCVIDTAAQPRAGISPSADNLPCVVRSAPFNQTLQVQCPAYYDSVVNLVITTYPITVTIDSMELDSVSGLPSGITWSKNPNRLKGGENGCLTFTGTTTDPTGYYHLGWFGTAWTHTQFIGSRTVTGNLNRYNYVNYYLNVISQGDPCVPYNPYSGINDLNNELNTALSISPNPSKGVFTVKLNAGSRVTGDIQIIDVTGRIVYSQDVDLIGMENKTIDISKCAKGIYTLILKTANGNAAKRISID